MIKQIQAAQAAIVEVTGIQFFNMLGQYRAVTPEYIIFFERASYHSGIGVIEKSSSAGVYGSYLDGCIKHGKEITLEEFIAASKEIVGKYAAQINFILEAEVAAQIFCL